MTFLEGFAISAILGMILYSANAACAHQQGAKLYVMRFVGTAAIVLLLAGAALIVLNSGKARIGRDFVVLGIILAVFLIGAAIRMLKRSLEACDRRDYKVRENQPLQHPIAWATAQVRQLFHTNTGSPRNGGSK